MRKPHSYRPRIDVNIEFAGRAVSFKSDVWLEKAERVAKDFLKPRSERRDFSPSAVLPDEESALEPFSENVIEVRFPLNH